MYFLKGTILAILIFIAWQDFKYKAVYWWLFVLLMLGLAIANGISIGWQQLLEQLLYNSAFLMLQLVLLTVYFSFKERRVVYIFNGYFGLGDLFFLIAVTVYFSFLNYLVYYAFSLMLVIIITLLTSMRVKGKDLKIPLAGYQALVLLGFMLAAEVFNVNFNSDVWLAEYLNF